MPDGELFPKPGTDPAELSVHPAAECYRLMHADEFAELADDVAENGLRDPITLGRVREREPAIIDGRNRLAACAAAGVAPHFETIDFADDAEVRAFVKSRNGRKNYTKGELAMGIAMLYPDPARGRGAEDPAAIAAETADISRRRIREARQVLRHSPELADAVMLDERPLNAAYEQAIALDRERTEKLAAERLAELVAEERMMLAEAQAAAT